MSKINSIKYHLYTNNLDGLADETKQALGSTGKGRKQQAKTTATNTEEGESSESQQQRFRIVLKFKKYLFQEKTIIAQ